MGPQMFTGCYILSDFIISIAVVRWGSGPILTRFVQSENKKIETSLHLISTIEPCKIICGEREKKSLVHRTSMLIN
jgi:hypothetical protein